MLTNVHVSVVIVNYRTGALACAAIESLAGERAAFGAFDVTIVDNASGDDSIERLRGRIERDGFSSWVRLIESQRNVGFAGGNNLALRSALAAPPAANYFLLLNPDAEVRPGAVRKLVEFLEVRRGAGIAGPRTEIGVGNVRGTAFRYHGVRSEFCQAVHLALADRLFRRHVLAPPAATSPHPTDWISGGCMLIRRRTLEETGLFDDRFFLYYEETDFCRRARAQGWQCWFVPEAEVIHHAGAATGITGDTALQRRVPDYWFESRNYYYSKHHARLYKRLVDLAWLSGHLLSRTLRALRGRPPAEPPHFLADFLRHNFVPRFLKRSRTRVAS